MWMLQAVCVRVLSEVFAMTDFKTILTKDKVGLFSEMSPFKGTMRNLSYGGVFTLHFP